MSQTSKPQSIPAPLRARRLMLAAFLAPACLLAAAGGEESIVPFLVGMVVVIAAAKLGGELLERMGQPAVLGELLFGVILGNLHLAGIGAFEPLRESAFLELAAQIGVILLLFEVGLHSHLAELIEVGMSALVVATLGVVVPMGLGYGVSLLYFPESPWYVHLFVGATLTATSVGITARVLSDIGRMATREARIILGAAVIDDVQGLIVLAVVTGIVTSVSATGQADLSLMPVLIISAKAAGFLAGAILLGRALARWLLKVGVRFRTAGIPLAIAISHCFALAALAGWMGLAPIVGAFAAGLVLEESDYEMYLERGELSITESVKPINALFVPVFFVLMGLRVDLSVFTSTSVLAFAAVLTLAAIAGKQICALGVIDRGVKRIAVGVGMIPRGEVGLIFAGMGATLTVGGSPVFSPVVVSAIVVMVMVTTLITPPALKVVMEGAHVLTDPGVFPAAEPNEQQ